MIAGHLQIKNDNYYMVLNYTDANGRIMIASTTMAASRLAPSARTSASSRATLSSR